MPQDSSRAVSTDPAGGVDQALVHADDLERADADGVDDTDGAAWDDDTDELGRPLLSTPAPLAWRRRTAIEMVISGIIGLYTSFVLSIEALELAANPAAALACDLSSTISCSKVAVTWQAQLLGFPNAFLGILAEGIVITLAVAAIGGVMFPRWFMLSAQVVYTAGLVFALWLFWQAWAVIGALCPWCLLITLTTTIVWAGLTRWNIRDGHLTLPGRAGPWARRFVASGNDWFITVAFLVVILILVTVKYGPSLLV